MAEENKNIDIPKAPLTEHYVTEIRQGVDVEYIPT